MQYNAIITRARWPPQRAAASSEMFLARVTDILAFQETNEGRCLNKNPYPEKSKLLHVEIRRLTGY